jgi:hypothetical protein
MGEMKVEHVLLFLVCAFLVYHMMGGCGCNRVEGFQNCKGIGIDDIDEGCENMGKMAVGGMTQDIAQQQCKADYYKYNYIEDSRDCGGKPIQGIDKDDGKSYWWCQEGDVCLTSSEQEEEGKMKYKKEKQLLM